MSVFTFDLSNYKETTSSYVPPATYAAVIEDVDVQESRNGNAMIVVTWRILGGEYDGDILIERLTQTEKAMFRTVAFLKGIGAQAPIGKRFKMNLNTLVGKKAYLDVADGEYRGKTVSNIEGYRRYSAPADTAAEDLDLDDDAAETATEDVEDDAAEAPAAEEAPAPKTEKPAETEVAEGPEEISLDDLDL